MDKRKTVLVIDDDIDLVESMKVILEAADYRVLTAYDPETGYNRAEREKPDIILLDVMFGNDEKVKGYEVALRVRNNKELASVPVLMITSVSVKITGREFPSDAEVEREVFDGYINKPAQPAELTAKIKELLDKKSKK